VTTRDPSEIQRAHDILRALVLGEIPSPFANKTEAHAALDAICWVLGHDHNTKFADNLKTIEEWAEEAGFILRDRGAPR